MPSLEIKTLPKKYQKLWRDCSVLLKKARPEDIFHAKETVQTVLNYQGRIKFNPDIIIPVAMMHDIGHSGILPQHFKYITGGLKLENSKLVHMLIGAKIAKELLEKNHFPKKQINEVVDIVSTHDFNRFKGIDLNKIYNTPNKKFFHDVDALDRFNPDRVKRFRKLYPDQKVLKKFLEKQLKIFFYPEFREIAKKRFVSFKHTF
jgi:5'-deoxynucleotidase YfbR-like HD superfamily hydrolase